MSLTPEQRKDMVDALRCAADLYETGNDDAANAALFESMLKLAADLGFSPVQAAEGASAAIRTALLGADVEIAPAAVLGDPSVTLDVLLGWMASLGKMSLVVPECCPHHAEGWRLLVNALRGDPRFKALSLIFDDMVRS